MKESDLLKDIVDTLVLCKNLDLSQLNTAANIVEMLKDSGLELKETNEEK